MTRTKYHPIAEQQEIPLRTLDDVLDTLTSDKAKGGGTDIAMARLMLKFGRLTPEALAYVQAYTQ